MRRLRFWRGRRCLGRLQHELGCLQKEARCHRGHGNEADLLGLHVEESPRSFQERHTTADAQIGAGLARRRDAARHPSPNAGVVEAAFAGALGVRLGGPTQYRHELEIRPTLGDGVDPGVGELRRAVRLSRLVQGAALAVAVALSAGVRTGRRASPPR